MTGRIARAALGALLAVVLVSPAAALAAGLRGGGFHGGARHWRGHPHFQGRGPFHGPHPGHFRSFGPHHFGHVPRHHGRHVWIPGGWHWTGWSWAWVPGHWR